MQRIIYCTVVLIAVVASATPTYAQQSPLLLSDAQMRTIEDNCQEAHAALLSLHQSDALLRVNLGQRYEDILRRLMTPFNTRATANGHDASTMIKITAQYNTALDDFRSHYMTYARSLETTLGTSCKNDPVKFYQAIEQTRQDRKVIEQDTTKISGYITAYKKSFEALAATIEKNGAAS